MEFTYEELVQKVAQLYPVHLDHCIAALQRDKLAAALAPSDTVASVTEEHEHDASDHPA